MPPELFIENYGYLALFAGRIVEGETVVVFAGFRACRPGPFTLVFGHIDCFPRNDSNGSYHLLSVRMRVKTIWFWAPHSNAPCGGLLNLPSGPVRQKSTPLSC